MNRLAAAALGLVPSIAGAQEKQSILFEFPNGNVYDGKTPVLVEVWAAWDPFDFAWADWGGDILSDDTSGVWSNLTTPINHTPSVPTPGATPGVASEGGVTGIFNGQLLFPPVFLASTANPILVWTGEWSSNDLSAREVALTSDTNLFHAYDPGVISMPNLQVNEGLGTIHVVPGPAGAGVIALGGLVVVRRRR